MDPLLGQNKDVRLSLAGAQDKLPVIVRNNKIALALNGAPTTHIIKPLIKNVKDSVYNEYFCLSLAKALGIKVPNVNIQYIEDVPYFIIERYDRQLEGLVIRRLHQEDFCQILSILPEQKYEAEGGPNIKQILQILGKYSVSPILDQEEFLKRVIFNYAIGNADAHGKNFAVLYKNNGLSLAPAYDILSTQIYQNLSNKMAMKIGRKYLAKNVLKRHWYEIIIDSKISPKMLDNMLNYIFSNIKQQADKLILNLEKENITSPIFTKIQKIIDKNISSIG